MVTHDRNEAYNMSSRIAVMDEGRLLTVKPSKALFADPGTVQAAMLTGCKNIVPARRVSDFEVEIPDWGLRMETKQRVGEGLCAVGIRAHYFSPAAPQNRFPVRYVEEMEEPFEVIIQFRYVGQYPDTPARLVAPPQGEKAADLSRRAGHRPGQYSAAVQVSPQPLPLQGSRR